MASPRSQTGTEMTLAPLPPEELDERSGADLRRLGEALKGRVDEVLELTVARAAEHEVEAVVEDSFDRIGRSSTLAVARWIAGERIDVAIEAGGGSWEVFGAGARPGAASRLEAGPEALAAALNILQLSLEFSLVRMCKCFEEERSRTDEELSRRAPELPSLAPH